MQSEGWYHEIGHDILGEYITIHYLEKFDEELMRSRCGGRVKNQDTMKQFVLISSPEGWKRVFCGNCDRLVVRDKWKKEQRLENESN